MLILFATASLAICSGLARSDDDAKARAALAIAKAMTSRVSAGPCDCVVTGVCRCDPATCNCGPGCPQHCGGVDGPAYAKAYRQAEKDGKPLVIWIGSACAPCIRSMDDCIHVTVSSYPKYASGVVVATYTQGCLREAGYWDRYPTAAEVRAVAFKTSYTSQGGSISGGGGGCPTCGASGFYGHSGGSVQYAPFRGSFGGYSRGGSRGSRGCSSCGG